MVAKLTPWGINISPKGICALKLQYKQGAYHIAERFSIACNVPLWANVNEPLCTELYNALKKIPKKLPFRREKVIIAIDKGMVSELKLKIDKIYLGQQKHHDKLIAEELKLHLVDDLSQFYWDYQYLGEDKSSAHLEFGVFLMQKSKLQPIITLFSKAKLSLVKVGLQSEVLNTLSLGSAQPVSATKALSTDEKLAFSIAQYPPSAPNLLPWRKQHLQQKSTQFVGALFCSLLLLAGILATIHFRQMQSLSVKQQLIEPLEKESSGLNLLTKKNRSKEKRCLDTLNKLKWVSLLYQNNATIFGQIEWLALHWPKSLFLMHLQYHNHVFHFVGHTLHPEQLNNWIKRISAKEKLNNPVLKMHPQVDSKRGLGFDFKVNLVQGSVK